MKTQRISAVKRGFTLMELMVAMAITTIIVTVLVSITSIALDTWNRSRAELRASRQAKSMIDTMARDFESLVVRRGNSNEWLSAVASTETVGDSIESTNSSEFIFFTAVTDRYNGQVGGAGDNGGDVSCVAYRLYYKNPIDAASTNFETFVVNRKLVNPDDTFESLLGETDTNGGQGLDDVFASTPFANQLEDPTNFVCENIFQFSVTFNVQVTQDAAGGGNNTVVNVPVTIGENNSAKEFKITGLGIDSDYNGNAVTNDELASGRITSVDISVTVISDFGIDQLSRRNFTDTQKAEFLAKNSYEYTKTVQIPSM